MMITDNGAKHNKSQFYEATVMSSAQMISRRCEIEYTQQMNY